MIFEPTALKAWNFAYDTWILRTLWSIFAYQKFLRIYERNPDKQNKSLVLSDMQEIVIFIKLGENLILRHFCAWRVLELEQNETKHLSNNLLMFRGYKMTVNLWRLVDIHLLMIHYKVYSLIEDSVIRNKQHVYWWKLQLIYLYIDVT